MFFGLRPIHYGLDLLWDETTKPKKMTLLVKKEHFLWLAYTFSFFKVEQTC